MNRTFRSMTGRSIAIGFALVVALVHLLPAAEGDGVTVRGRVSGQTEQGEFTGIVPSATVELRAADGTTAGSATTDETGFYEIGGLLPGAYTYRLAATGYAEDDTGRGFVIPDGKTSFEVDFLLSQGLPKPLMSGQLNGKVWFEADGVHIVMENAIISVQKVNGGPVMKASTDAEGSFSFDVASGAWRVSASLPGFDPQVFAGNLVVGDSTVATAEFVFSMSQQVVPVDTAEEVYARVSVEVIEDDAHKGTPPQVRFVNAESGEAFAATVTPVGNEDIAALGATFSGDYEWYDAEPSKPLPEGRYLAEGVREGLPKAESDTKAVSADATTIFDVDLFTEATRRDASGDDVMTVTADPVVAGLRGRVTGQSQTGEFLGIVAGAQVELLDSEGATAASAQADASGFYEIVGLGAGAWRYRISGDGYQTDDQGKGFLIPEGSAGHVRDFILSPVLEKIATGTIQGHVWRDDKGEKEAIAGAIVTVQREGQRSTTAVTTDAEGAYSIEVPAANWRASALSDDFEAKVTASAFPIEAGSGATVDFTFSKGDLPDIVFGKEVYALVLVNSDRAETAETVTPSVDFVTVDGSSRTPGTVRRMGEEELESYGVFSGPGGMKLREWYEAVPSKTLPVGSYRAEGKLEGFKPDTSHVRSISATASTTFDLTLDSFQQDYPDDITVIDTESGTARLHGRVTGQTLAGEFEGVLSGAPARVWPGHRSNPGR